MYNGIQFHASTYEGYNACSFYRSKAVTTCISEKVKDNIHFFECSAYLRDDTFLSLCDSYRLARLWKEAGLTYFIEYLNPIAKRNKFPIIVDYDDVMCPDVIPYYNRNKPNMFLCKDYDLKTYMDNSDIITVTTELLRDFYVDRLGIDTCKFSVIDNHVPDWWFGGLYNFDCILDNYMKSKNRPRIMVSCGSSHFSGGIVDVDDDFSGIINWIIKNRKRYEFIIQGGLNKQLWDYKDDILFVEGSDLHNYPYVRASYKPVLYLMPLQDTTFNRCKSAIRLYEADAEGIPIVLQNIPPYSGKTDLVFSDESELDGIVYKLLNDVDFYKDQVICARERHLRNKLENHIDDWLNIMRRSK